MRATRSAASAVSATPCWRRLSSTASSICARVVQAARGTKTSRSKGTESDIEAAAAGGPPLCWASVRATSTASRVLPAPPGPRNTTSRCFDTAAASALPLASKPTRRVRYSGKRASVFGLVSAAGADVVGCTAGSAAATGASGSKLAVRARASVSARRAGRRVGEVCLAHQTVAPHTGLDGEVVKIKMRQHRRAVLYGLQQTSRAAPKTVQRRACAQGCRRL